MSNSRNVILKLSDVSKILKMANIFQKPVNVELYKQAFVHKSFVSQANEKSYDSFEFYGDSIVSAATVKYLFERYSPSFEEGQLTKLKNKIVSTSFLCRFGRYFDLSRFILLSDYIENVYGRNVDKLLEDCFEAFVAAISLDIDYLTAMKFVRFCIDNLVDFGTLLHINENYKDIILNYFQLKNWSYPVYEIETELGPQYRKTFVVNILKSYNKGQQTIREVICKGIGKTKKKGEHDASFNALQKFGALT